MFSVERSSYATLNLLKIGLQALDLVIEFSYVVPKRLREFPEPTRQLLHGALCAPDSIDLRRSEGSLSIDVAHDSSCALGRRAPRLPAPTARWGCVARKGARVLESPPGRLRLLLASHAPL